MSNSPILFYSFPKLTLTPSSADIRIISFCRHPTFPSAPYQPNHQAFPFNPRFILITDSWCTLNSTAIQECRFYQKASESYPYSSTYCHDEFPNFHFLAPLQRYLVISVISCFPILSAPRSDEEGSKNIVNIVHPNVTNMHSKEWPGRICGVALP